MGGIILGATLEKLLVKIPLHLEDHLDQCNPPTLTGDKQATSSLEEVLAEPLAARGLRIVMRNGTTYSRCGIVPLDEVADCSGAAEPAAPAVPAALELPWASSEQFDVPGWSRS